MGYERYPRGTSQGDDGRRQYPDDGRDYRSGPDGGQRGYEPGYGQRPGGDDRYAQRGGRDESRYGGREQGRPGYGQGGSYAGGDRGRYGQSTDYHGSYASDGHRFEDVGRYAHADDDDARDNRGRRDAPPQDHDGGDRGFFQRAGDEVRSWFGDEDAERRRDMDQRYDDRQGGGSPYGDRASHHRDSDYHNWRSGQIAALDRDYEEYRQEHRSKFENEFASWRTTRQGQRDSLSRASEHMEVVGSDGEHVGTVDKVRGDRILLTRSDADAGGRHHSIPSRWVDSVMGEVTLTKTAAEAKQQWQDEERNQAMFGYGDHAADRTGQSGSGQGSEAQASSRSTSSAKTY